MSFWSGRTRLVRITSRVSLWFEPRYLMLGYFHGYKASYLCIVPMLPVRVEPGRNSKRGRDQLYVARVR